MDRRVKADGLRLSVYREGFLSVSQSIEMYFQLPEVAKDSLAGYGSDRSFD
jgi:hypothetical protein